MHQKQFARGFPGKLVPTEHRSDAFVPDPLPPRLERDLETDELNERALLALGELRAIIPSLPNPELITVPFLRREAVLSSKIEGTKTELEGLYLFETAKPSKPTEVNRAEYEDARDVANYVIALEHGMEAIKRLPVCNRVLRECHERLMQGVDHERGAYASPGRFRNTLAYIGSDLTTARYVAPPHDQIDGLMHALETYVNSKYALPTLVVIALIHYQFEAIHPFADGNGRVGRVLISLLLIWRGVLPGPLLYLSAYLNRNKDEYVQRLWEVSRSGDWMGWIRFFLQGVIEEAGDASKRSRELLNLREHYRQFLQRDRSAAISLALLDQLFQWPVISASRAKEVLKMTHQGAQNHIDRLVAKGILVEATGRGRNRMYLARPIVKIVS